MLPSEPGTAAPAALEGDLPRELEPRGCGGILDLSLPLQPRAGQDWDSQQPLGHTPAGTSQALQAVGR